MDTLCVFLSAGAGVTCLCRGIVERRDLCVYIGQTCHLD